MKNLFAYGTLMCEDIMREVTRYSLASVPGILAGFSRLLVKNELYPAIFYDQEGSVEGLVYRDVPLLAWQRLDRFEGDIYVRTSVPVRLNNDKIVISDTYVLQENFRDLLDTVDWNFSEFLSKNKDEFLCRYKGFCVL